MRLRFENRSIPPPKAPFFVILSRSISIRALAEWAIYNRVEVAIVSPDRYEQRMMALAFCVQCDNLLPECGVYASQSRCLSLEVGSRVHFVSALEQLKSREFHALVIEGVRLGLPEALFLERQYCRVAGARGVMRLGTV